MSLLYPMLAKSEGERADRAPLFAELTSVAVGEGVAGDVQWNFEKWLLAPGGEVVGRFRPLVEPADPALRTAVEGVLPD